MSNIATDDSGRQRKGKGKGNRMHRIAVVLAAIALALAGLVPVAASSGAAVVRVASQTAAASGVAHREHHLTLTPVTLPRHLRVGQRVGPFLVCLKATPWECLRPNGSGNQYTIDSTNWGHMTFILEGYLGGAPIWVIENGAGNCLYEASNGSHRVMDGDRSCTGTQHEEWVEYDPSSTTFRLLNMSTSDYMETDGTISGYKVWAYQTTSGHWYTWTAFDTT